MSSVEIEERKRTPMMEQWAACKAQAKEAVLFFRMGDFYEAFYEDAEVLAEELELTLTKRQEIPMSGVPWHTCESYIDRLVGKGYRVAIAEQVEDPKVAKGLVKREIVRFVTPGTVIGSSLVPEKSTNFLVSLTQVGSLFGIAALELTTARFQVIELTEERELLNELYRLRPAELVVSKKFREKYPLLLRETGASLSEIEEWHYAHKTASETLTNHFRLAHLDGFGLEGKVAAINAAGALLAYVRDTLFLPVSHLKEIHPYSTEEVLLIDRASQKNLELTESFRDGSRKHTLLHVLDETYTPMGGRLLREWIKKPLLSAQEINKRQEGVEAFYHNSTLRGELRQEFRTVRDLERLMMRVSSGLANPRDLLSLKLSIANLPKIHSLIETLEAPILQECASSLVDLSSLVEKLERAISDEPPIRIAEGNIFKEGYHSEVDELRNLAKGGKEWLANYQARIKESTGIKNLKVHFNKVFGYYIEVSKGQAHLMPENFERRQTLVNSERFISPTLKQYEEKVLTAQERRGSLEQRLFFELREEVAAFEKEIFQIARSIAHLDVLVSLAEVAKRNQFCRPLVDESDRIEIQEGRHPVVEASHPETYIPNDTTLFSQERLMLITGPNMAGKSTYIRQVALIVILAQMGSFVPATRARIGVVDKIFTRIGASDDLSRGQSTFMVEMSETANILHNATSRSLVILDEIGRGTSTYDGVAIAWSVAEYLLTTPEKQPKTLFATHYWELTELEKKIPGAVNYHATVQEWKEEIVFLHKIEKGGADKSYGIHVARLAGLPLPVLARAQTILKKLESRKESRTKEKKGDSPYQLTLF
ncbi:MAG: DNA mismatch repair protein MutS [Chlamydiae bacterium]|nr:DNA mismatch repair protein MutS [Chlamydiota bacterium]